MGGRQDDIRGRRFGRLVTAEPTRERKNGYTVWRCVCDCGNEILASSRHLKHGWITDCGCVSKQKKKTLNEEKRNISSVGVQRKDWIGKSFGDLEVVSYDGRRGGKHYWRCRCRCGGEAVVSQSNLQGGHTRSCGCRTDLQGTRHFVEGTCIESIRSRKIFASNKSGVRGVYQNGKTSRWVAQITFQGRTRYLGSYDRIEEAAEAREKAEKVFQDFLERFYETENKNMISGAKASE